MNQSQERIVPAAGLQALEEDIFRKLGFTEEGSRLAAKSLVEADLRGVSSHGALRIPTYAARVQHGVVTTDGPLELIADHGATAVIDGRHTLGQIPGTRAMELAIAKAEEYGVGCVGVCHSHHYGTAAYYAQMAAAKGMVGMSMTNTAPLMPPLGGLKKVVGTNPISIAVPSRRHFDVVLDMATSTVAHGKLQIAAKEGKPIPLGWATDAQGNPTTDAKAAIDGGFLSPVGGPKGFGLAVIIDLLCGPLVGSACGDKLMPAARFFSAPQNCGNLFLAIRISAFRDLDTFLEEVDAYIDFIKSCPTNDTVDGVYMPGELEALRREQRLCSGIPLPEAVVRDLCELAESLGLEPKSYLA
jgi:ureidoglycolate dehydrogenase (NAD+)